MAKASGSPLSAIRNRAFSCSRASTPCRSCNNVDDGLPILTVILKAPALAGADPQR